MLMLMMLLMLLIMTMMLLFTMTMMLLLMMMLMLLLLLRFTSWVAVLTCTLGRSPKTAHAFQSVVNPEAGDMSVRFRFLWLGFGSAWLGLYCLGSVLLSLEWFCFGYYVYCFGAVRSGLVRFWFGFGSVRFGWDWLGVDLFFFSGIILLDFVGKRSSYCCCCGEKLISLPSFLPSFLRPGLPRRANPHLLCRHPPPPQRKRDVNRSGRGRTVYMLITLAVSFFRRNMSLGAGKRRWRSRAARHDRTVRTALTLSAASA